MPEKKHPPFKAVGEFKILSRDTAQSNVFEFEVKDGTQMVNKELKYPTRLMSHYEGITNLQELAHALKGTYEVLKKYLGEHLVDTHFIIGSSERDTPTILMVQKKINGKRLDTLNKEELEKIEDQIKNIREMSDMAEGDLKLNDLKFKMDYPEYRFIEANLDVNQILDESGKVRVIDW